MKSKSIETTDSGVEIESSNDDKSIGEKIHLVVLAVYKEPLELLLSTVDSLANQTVADHTVLTIGFEERSPEAGIVDMPSTVV